MRVFLDTEFTELNRYTSRLISLALVADDGREFYIELVDGWDESNCSDFVREIVLPQLDIAKHGRNATQAKSDLLDFLAQLAPNDTEIEIVSDAPDWDWPLLVGLAGTSGLPANVVCSRLYLADDGICPGEPPHHALLDARLLKQFDYLHEIAAQVPIRQTDAGTACINLIDIPQPCRDQFEQALRGSGAPAPGPSGPRAWAQDWFAWLSGTWEGRPWPSSAVAPATED